MKTKTTLLLLAGIAFGLSASSAQAVELAVNYDHAGLTQIRIERGQLHFVWHTERKYGQGELVPMRQDMSSYDRHEVHIWLTADEAALLLKWIETHTVFDLPVSYPNKVERTYGAAFQTILSVMLGDQQHSMVWTGDSITTKELRAAESELRQLCEKIRKDREK